MKKYNKQDLEDLEDAWLEEEAEKRRKTLPKDEDELYRPPTRRHRKKRNRKAPKVDRDS